MNSTRTILALALTAGPATMAQAFPSTAPQQLGAPRAIALASTGRDAIVSDLAQRWQGAWVVHDADYPGSVQAWKIDGSSVTVYDASTRQRVVEAFAIESPCRLECTQPLSGKGQMIVTTNTFAFARRRSVRRRQPGRGRPAERLRADHMHRRPCAHVRHQEPGLQSMEQEHDPIAECRGRVPGRRDASVLRLSPAASRR
jgi:hypothetical protein